jgi:DNA recombination protein RmuC
LKHVDDIARKYIQPGEGTMQFALMYVPSERVYYEVFADSDGGLVTEALRRGVIPVSPSTLFLYLQTVAYGLRGLVIPEQAQELSREIAQLRADFRRFLKTQELAGTHLRNLQKAFDEAAVRIARVDAAIGRIGGDPGPFDRSNGGDDRPSDGASE